MVGTRGSFVDGIATIQNPSFVTDAAIDGTYCFQCTATNSSGESLPDVDKGDAQLNVVVKTQRYELTLLADYQWQWGAYNNNNFSLFEDAIEAVESRVTDLEGTEGNATSLQGRTLASTAPTEGQAVAWNSTLSRWEPKTVLPTGLTPGGVVFAGESGGLAQSATNFFWDNTNSRLGVGTNAPSLYVHIARATEVASLGLQSGATGTGTNTAYINLIESSTNYWHMVKRSAAYTNEGNNLAFGYYSGSWNSAVLVLSTTGKIGIGTPTPTAKLHLLDNTTSPALCLESTLNGAGDNTGSLVFTQSSSNYWLITKRSAAYTSEGNNLFFSYYNGSTWVNPLAMTPTGRLGIGTLTPDTNSKVHIVASDTTDDWFRGLKVLNPSLVVGKRLLIALGSADSAKNMAQMAFYHAGAGSDSNRVGFGFHSANEETLVFLPTGRVGIKTTSPEATLHVAYNSTLLAKLGTGIAFTSTTDSQAWMGSNNWGYDGSAWSRTASTNAAIWGCGSAGQFAVWTVASGEAQTTAPDASHCKFLVTNDGKVGIGTDTPGNNLSIYHATASVFVALKCPASGVSASGGISLQQSDTNYWNIWKSASGNAPANGLVFSYYGGSWIHALTLLADGKVGIDTTTPTTTLDVNGTLAFKESGGTRLAVGSVADGLYLKRVGTELVGAVGGGGSVPLTTKGDLCGYDTAVARIPVGADGKTLVADSSQALGLKWASQVAAGLASDGTLTTAAALASNYSVASASYADVTGLTVTVTTVAGESIMVSLTGFGYSNTGSNSVYILLLVDGVPYGAPPNGTIEFGNNADTVGNISFNRMVTGLSAGSHVVKIQAKRDVSSTTVIYAPATLQAIQFRGGYITPENVPILKYNSVSTIDVVAAPGADAQLRVMLTDGSRYISNAALTVNLTVSGRGGLDTGSEASSTWYYVYAVPATTSGQLAVVASVTAPGSGGPTGFSAWKYLGAIRNDGSSNIVKFYQAGNEFVWSGTPATPFYDNTGTDASAVLMDLATEVPQSASRYLLNSILYGAASASWHSYYVSTGSGAEALTFLDQYVSGANDASASVTFFPLPNERKLYRKRSGSISQHLTMQSLGWTDGWLGQGAPQVQAKAVADTKLPRLTWVGNSSVTAAAAPGQPGTVRVTLQDGTQRSFTGTLTFDPSTGAVDGGLDTGTEAVSTWYYLYLVPKSTDASLLTIRGSVTGPATGPTGYTNWAYVGAARNNGSSNLLKFKQSGRTFKLLPYINIESGGTFGVDAGFISKDLSAVVPVSAGAARIVFGGIVPNGENWPVLLSGDGTNAETYLYLNGTYSYGNSESELISMVTPQTIYRKITRQTGSTTYLPWWDLTVTGWEDDYLS
jgi:hypothetical protein